MSLDKRARRLQDIALRAARRAEAERGGKPLTREELLALPVSPFALLWSLLLALGILIATAGVFLILAAASLTYGAAGLLVGAALCYLGGRLRPRPLQAHLATHDPLAAELIVGAIFEVLRHLK